MTYASRSSTVAATSAALAATAETEDDKEKPLPLAVLVDIRAETARLIKRSGNPHTDAAYDRGWERWAAFARSAGLVAHPATEAGLCPFAAYGQRPLLRRDRPVHVLGRPDAVGMREVVDAGWWPVLLPRKFDDALEAALTAAP